MAYRQDLPSAARRHLASGQSLYSNNRKEAHEAPHRSVAGYLFGVAGELAVKQMMRESGMNPLRSDHRRDDPFYAHFPTLKILLRDSAKGRRSAELLAIGRDVSLFQHWDTDMRYAPTSDIQAVWTERWKESAEELIGKIGL